MSTPGSPGQQFILFYYKSLLINSSDERVNAIVFCNFLEMTDETKIKNIKMLSLHSTSNYA